MELKKVNSNIIEWFKRDYKKIKNIKSFILLIRHAEKQSDSEKLDENQIVLTKSGKKEAIAFGKELSLLWGDIQYVKSSPIERCVTTANLILQGMGNNLEIITSTNLGDPGVFITNKKLAGKHFQTYGCEKVVQFQIEGKELEGIRDLKIGCKLLLNDFLMDLKSNKGSGIYVSHDAIIVPFIYYITGNVKVTQKWIKYLEGTYLWLDEGKMVLLWDGERYEIPY